MKLFLSFVLILIGALAHPLPAQVSVQLKMERDTYLLYEPLPVEITIRNVSGRPVQLDDWNGKSWLEMVGSDDRGATVRVVGNPAPQPALLINPGEAIVRKLDILPMLEIRSRGSYQVHARVDAGSGKVFSLPVKFNIIQGREIWTQTASVIGPNREADEVRQYSLQVRRQTNYDFLHLCVRDDSRGLILGMLNLGVFVPTGNSLHAMTDRSGACHVLFRSAARELNYARVSPQAELLSRAVYTDVLSAPSLVVEPDGYVLVKGGEKIFPKPERSDTALDLAPEPADDKAAKKPSQKQKPVATTKQPVEETKPEPQKNFGPR